MNGLRWTLACLLGIVVSCGEEASSVVQAGSSLHLASLELKAEPARPQQQEIERYRLLRPTSKTPWKVNESVRELSLVSESKEDGPRYALALDEPQGAKINLPGPFDGRRFNTIAVEAEISRKLEFTLNFVSGGKLLNLRGTATSKKAAGKQVLHFELPTLYQATEVIQRMRLVCNGNLKGFRLHSVDLLRKPLDRLLPSPASGPDLILVDDEKRRGVGISPEYGVRSKSPVHASSVLRFSYAAPAQTANESLELTIRDSQGRSESHSFAPEGKNEFTWHDVRLPLASFAGEQVELLWSVKAEPLTNWALAEVGMLTGSGEPVRVLLITSDTHRADHLGAAHSDVEVRTPYLDALAERGILFEDCFTATNITNPSHIALMTARHPRDTGILSNNEPVSLSADTLAEAFHGAGFATYASVSARHLSDRTSGLGQGFDRMSEPRIVALRRGGVSVGAMTRWIEANQDVPLFMWMHVFDAHVPYAPPEELLTSYYPDTEAAFDPDAPQIPDIPSHVYEFIFPGLKDLAYPKALYAGEVTYLDDKLNRIFAMPSMQDAVIAFTSDHGESLGQHGVFYAHADLFPDSLHVPLILTHPGGERGVRSNASVRQIDLGRTLLDLAGQFSVEFPGENLLERVSMQKPAGPARFAIGAGAASASICSDGWHLIFALTDVRGHHRIDERPRHQVVLYNLNEDPESKVNLLETEFERATLLRRRLLDWLADAQDLGWRGAQVMDEETLRSLEALGYTAGADQTPSAIELYPAGCACEWCARFDG